MNILKDKLGRKEFVITCELFAPKGTDISASEKKYNLLRNYVDAFNVTDNQRATMRAGSLAISRKIIDWGGEPVFQLCCRDRNRLALQSDLLSANILGIENVLFLTGDHPTVGDHNNVKPVFDLDAVQLLETASILEQGTDLCGNGLKGKITFFKGAVVNPSTTPLEPHVIKMKKKISKGAQFFQTQVVFNPEKYAEFAQQTASFNVPVLASVSILKSYDYACFLQEKVPGIDVPQYIVERLKNAPDYKEERLKITAEIMKAVKPYCQGFHIMAFGLEKYIPEILKEAGIV